MSNALSSLLAGYSQGSQQADGMSAQMGLRPSGPQPMGSPQLAVQFTGQLKAEIAKLNSIADMIRNAGLAKSSEYVYDVIDCTKKLQGIVMEVDKELQELQQNQGPPGQRAA